MLRINMHFNLAVHLPLRWIAAAWFYLLRQAGKYLPVVRATGSQL